MIIFLQKAASTCWINNDALVATGAHSLISYHFASSDIKLVK